MSLIKYFLPSRKTAVTGRDKTIEQAVKSPHKTVSRKLLLNADNATGRVVISGEFVTIKGHIKLFHVVINVNRARVTRALSDNGKAILKNVCNMLHPSIFAASSISDDMLLNIVSSKIRQNLRIRPAKSKLDMCL